MTTHSTPAAADAADAESPDPAVARALVTGASRGFGRAIAAALCSAGAEVVGVARDGAALGGVGEALGAAFTPEAGDAADPDAAERLIARYRPDVLVLNAGAAPPARPVHEHTWETFGAAWDMDVKQAFHWTRAALRLPLAPGSTVVAFSSGAAVAGSPLSGGYAGAKATIRFLTSYAGEESDRAGLGIRFVSVLPRLTPETELGAAAVASYAERQGVDVATFLKGFGPTLTPAQVGAAVLSLTRAPFPNGSAHLLTPAGLTPAP
jgi:NAD(P)-dependent dehydrogenase (short-subunit alcohol dehydrogenase family)